MITAVTTTLLLSATVLGVVAPASDPVLRASLAPARPPDLPRHVFLKTGRQSFNRRYYAALLGGSIYYKANEARTGVREDWKPLPLPPGVDGQVVELGVDDFYVIAIGRDRAIHTMMGFLGEPDEFEWVPGSRWGSPFWRGKGMKLPETTRSWDVSFNSVEEDRYYTDPAGNRQSVGSGCTSLYALGANGRDITLIDPWLPTDLSYRVCGPKRNRFEARSLSSSGSTLFLVGGRGDLYVRTYDFDIAGGDWFFFPATYEDMSDPAADPGFYFASLWRIPRFFLKRFTEGISNLPRQLPPLDWARQAKVAGMITDRITITKEGPGGLRRPLRVEGVQAGRTGYFQTLARFSETDSAGRPVAQNWEFVPTDEPLLGRLLENPPGDTSEVDLAPAEDRDYPHDAGREGLDARHPWTASVRGFHPYCTPSTLAVRFVSGETLDLALHTRETIRQDPRQPALDDEPFVMQGAVELPRATAADRAALGPASRWFVDEYFEDSRFVEVDVAATRKMLTVDDFADVDLALEAAAP